MIKLSSLSKEIERKFLVDAGALIRSIASGESRVMLEVHIVQSYLFLRGEYHERIRKMLRNSTTSYVKASKVELESVNGCSSRVEVESAISEFEYNAFLKNIIGKSIEKTRRVVRTGDTYADVDYYEDGLVVAEFELEAETTELSLPSWVRDEVTGKPEYSNLHIAGLI